MQPILVSVHLPKTAGSSFGRALREHFGDRMLRDYGDFPLHKTRSERLRQALDRASTIQPEDMQSFRCVHGHFLPIKYRGLERFRDVTYVTWMREPVERLVSHYYYWKSNYHADSAPLHRRVVEENWTLDRFCLSSELRNIYSEFLCGFPLDRFDFIGLTEHFDEDVEALGQRLLPVTLVRYRENAAADRRAIPLQFRRRVEDFHAADVSVYQHAVALRNKRNLANARH